MDIFKKNKLLLRLVLLLAVLNLFSIAFIWWQRKEDHNKTAPKRDFEKTASLLKKELQLSGRQEADLKNLRETYFQKESVLSDLIKSQRDSMNAGMFKDITDTGIVRNIARRVADNEYQMELYRLEQAEQLKVICTKEQLEKFRHLVKEIRDYFQPGKNN